MIDVNSSLLKQAKEGNLWAFEQMVFECEKPLYSFLFRLCGHKQTAEDLTQETFVKIYKNLNKINPEERFTSWLFTIATNTFYDFLRKKKHIQELFIIDDPESDFETISEDKTYSIIENAEEIDKALETLKPEYKTVLLLFYRHDLPYEKIAKTLKIPIGTIKTYLHRAKQALKDNLQRN